jgi:hypothetical protein
MRLVAPVRIDAAARMRLLADGLRAAGEGYLTHAHMDVWPIFSRLQLRRFDAELTTFAADLATTRELVAGVGPHEAPMRDAIAGVEALEQLATGDAMRSRGGMRQLGTDAIALADQIDSTLPARAEDAADLAAARRELFSRFGDGAAEIVSRDAAALAELLPPAIAGPKASAYLGVSSPEHAAEFVHTLQKAGRLEASTFERERLGMIELMGRETPASDERIRAIALDIVSSDPNELSAPAFNRMAMLLELDPGGRILDGPRELGGSARSFPDAMRAIADRFSKPGRPRIGSATRQYFEQWQQVLRAHTGVDGQPLRPAGHLPNAERIFMEREPEPLQLVQDLGKVGSSSFPEIKRALEYVDRRMATVATEVPPELNGTVTDTRKLAIENIERLGGSRTDGYSFHPDYAALGRIRTNTELVERVLAERADAAAAEAATRPVELADDGERIAW